MKICSKCGERNEDWMNICQRCGSSIENADQDNTQVTYEFEKNQYDVSSNDGQQSYGFDDNNSSEKYVIQNMDLKIILVILLIILGILIIIALGKL